MIFTIRNNAFPPIKASFYANKMSFAGGGETVDLRIAHAVSRWAYDIITSFSSI